MIDLTNQRDKDGYIGYSDSKNNFPGLARRAFSLTGGARSLL